MTRDMFLWRAGLRRRIGMARAGQVSAFAVRGSDGWNDCFR